MPTLKIVHDPEPLNPRKEYDHLGTMICFHRRHRLGDKHGYRSEDFDNWDDMERHLLKEHPVVLPLYLFDHSGLALSTTPFHCPWDSGQVGFIVMEREALLKEYGVKIATQDAKRKAEKVLRAEVDEYGQYLSGDVWGYVVEDDDGEHIDSCWGFYGRAAAEEAGREALEAEMAV